MIYAQSETEDGSRQLREVKVISRVEDSNAGETAGPDLDVGYVRILTSDPPMILCFSSYEKEEQEELISGIILFECVGAEKERPIYNIGIIYGSTETVETSNSVWRVVENAIPQLSKYKTFQIETLQDSKTISKT